ncbi:MAG TPA: hypothetical protein VER37_03945, partial [Thermomicrobiales bacterium]|nr:hypothetical protein [Thermomicrobiales bacterium]
PFRRVRRAGVTVKTFPETYGIVAGIDFLGVPFEAKTNPIPLDNDRSVLGAGEHIPDLVFGVNLDRN